jgi:DNA-binding NarL/FixJ family response regulator
MLAPWFGGTPPAWILLVFDPDSRLTASTGVIRRDLRVSECEIEVAASLVTGYDIRAVARPLNMSVHTARTHLKAILLTTGMRSQTELLRRIVSDPLGIRRSRL